MCSTKDWHCLRLPQEAALEPVQCRHEKHETRANEVKRKRVEKKEKEEQQQQQTMPGTCSENKQ